MQAAVLPRQTGALGVASASYIEVWLSALPDFSPLFVPTFIDRQDVTAENLDNVSLHS